MGYTLPEPAIDKVIAQLTGSLPAKITALAPTFAPALAMRQIAEMTLGERLAHKGFPAIEVIPIESPILLDNNQAMTWRHELAIAIFVRDAKEDNLSRLLLRYARCVIETLADRRDAKAFAPWDFDMNESTLDWSPTRVAEGQQYERDVTFPIRMTIAEQRT